MFNTLIDNVRLVAEIARPIIKPAVPLIAAGVAAATASVAVQKLEKPSSDEQPTNKREAILKAIRENKMVFAAGLALLAGASTGSLIRLVQVALSKGALDHAMYRAIASSIAHKKPGYIFDGPVFNYGYMKIFGDTNPVMVAPNKA